MTEEIGLNRLEEEAQIRKNKKQNKSGKKTCGKKTSGKKGQVSVSIDQMFLESTRGEAVDEDNDDAIEMITNEREEDPEDQAVDGVDVKILEEGVTLFWLCMKGHTFLV